MTTRLRSPSTTGVGRSGPLNPVSAPGAAAPAPPDAVTPSIAASVVASIAPIVAKLGIYFIPTGLTTDEKHATRQERLVRPPIAADEKLVAKAKPACEAPPSDPAVSSTAEWRRRYGRNPLANY
jgi:hypothetical protein